MTKLTQFLVMIRVFGGAVVEGHLVGLPLLSSYHSSLLNIVSTFPSRWGAKLTHDANFV